MLPKPKRKRDLTVYSVKGDMQSYATEATIESLYDTWIFIMYGAFFIGLVLDWNGKLRRGGCQLVGYLFGIEDCICRPIESSCGLRGASSLAVKGSEELF